MIAPKVAAAVRGLLPVAHNRKPLLRVVPERVLIAF